ncbi:MAG: nucleotide pyrophosphohydrolase [Methanosphaera sp.]|uniref:nucleotide pyrophosphohydrolase n=1 Tax=Methanosphaera sp. ISO3-F5 TaxID=1452353 RepID=UPI002B261A99|nr:nucleotide pyrophosphohydrolase [Methanosphaera sp. ISO3-F5]MBR0472536.1 nucleotide pyrophosphohydrolase [Methanosphaera sp.]WQH64135.1 nucleotide pyrophosphohydrolase [Methanosphaera sp. ISO3-F5]
MKEVIDRIIKFRDDRDWKQFQTLENLAKSISIESGELLENFQWDDEYDVEHVEEELADVLIYSYLMAITMNVDIKEIMLKKIEKNEIKYPVTKCRGKSTKYTELI